MIVAHRSEVYAFHRSMGHVEKISFHSSGVCRQAFVDGQPLPAGMTDRVLYRWKKAATPKAGTNLAVTVLTIIFPTAHLALEAPASGKAVYVPAAAEGYSRVARLIFTADKEQDFTSSAAAGGWHLIAYHSLLNGESIALVELEAPWDGRTIIQERPDEPEDIVLPGFATPSIPRPGGKGTVTVTVPF